MKIIFNTKYDIYNYIQSFKNSIVEIFGESGSNKSQIAIYLAYIYDIPILYLNNAIDDIDVNNIRIFKVNNKNIHPTVYKFNLDKISDTLSVILFKELKKKYSKDYILLIDDIPILLTQLLYEQEKKQVSLSDLLNKNIYNEFMQKYISIFIKNIYTIYNLFNEQIGIFLINNKVGFLNDSFFGNKLKLFTHYRINIEHIYQQEYTAFLIKDLYNNNIKYPLFRIKK